jgi:hypothetical protein
MSFIPPEMGTIATDLNERIGPRHHFLRAADQTRMKIMPGRYIVSHLVYLVRMMQTLVWVL